MILQIFIFLIMALKNWTWFFVYIAAAFALKDPHKSPNVGIIGGHSISIQQVPFMASVRLNETYHWCGGSIIHEQFILTAAHCIEPDQDYKVVVGTSHLEIGGHVYDVEKIIPHEQYSPTTMDYDICIMKLAKPLVFDDKVAKIELADNTKKIKSGSLVEITGWGDTTPSGNISDVLMQVKIPIVRFFSCQLSYMTIKISPRMLCAGGDGKDSCQGDSGGPLTQDGIQIGIASFGAKCGDLPGVYTKVSALRPWIDEKIKEHLN